MCGEKRILFGPLGSGYSLLALTFAITLASATIAPAHGDDSTLLLESERISKQYNPDEHPSSVRSDLPNVVDEKGQRDVFFYADKTFSGRVVQFRFPSNAVSNEISLARLPRHAINGFGLSVLWPDLRFSVREAINANVGYIPREVVSIGVAHADRIDMASRLIGVFGRSVALPRKYPQHRFEVIDPIVGFDQGIRHIHVSTPQNHPPRDYTDDYIKWEMLGDYPVKHLRCRVADGARSTCHLDIGRELDGTISISIDFDSGYLPILPEIESKIVNLLNSSIVRKYSAQPEQGNK